MKGVKAMPPLFNGPDEERMSPKEKYNQLPP